MKKFFDKEYVKNAFYSFLCWVTVYIVPPGFKLAFTGFAKWYASNGYYKFNKGSTLCLKQRNMYGYGIRPLATIVGYEEDENTKEGYYIIAMEKDETGNFFEYMKTGKVDEAPKRVVKLEKHFKWNIEHKFKRCMT